MWAKKRLYILPLQLAAQKAPPQSPPRRCLSCPLPATLSHHSSLVTSLRAFSRTVDVVICVLAPHALGHPGSPQGAGRGYVCSLLTPWCLHHGRPPKKLPFALPLSFLALFQSLRSLSCPFNIPTSGSSAGCLFCRERSSVTRQYASLPHLRVVGTCLTTLCKIIAPTHLCPSPFPSAPWQPSPGASDSTGLVTWVQSAGMVRRTVIPGIG